jgi:hypothetical protein
MFSVRQEVSVKNYLDALQAYDCFFFISSSYIRHIFFSEGFLIK